MKKTISFKGTNITIEDKVNVGDVFPNFKATNKDLSDFNLEDYRGKVLVINAFPSVDTGVCAVQTTRFNQEIKNYDNAVVIGIAKSSTDLFHILFGNILAVQDIDMYITIGVGIFVLLVIRLFFKELLLTSFDELLAKAMGMKVNFYHYLLMILLTLVSVTAMQSVGTILIVAMLITPAATAYLYANSLKTMIFLSSTIGAVCSVLGLFIGYSFNIAAGSSIVLTLAAVFVISFFIAPKQRFIRHKQK